MQKSLPVFLAIVGLCAATIAQDAPAKKAAFVPTASPAETPAAEPKKESRGVLQTLFGSRQKRPPVAPKPAPAPKVAAATPAPAMPQAEPTPARKPKIAKPKPGKKNAPAATAPLTKKTKPKSKPTAPEPEPAVAKTEPPAATPDKPEPPAPTPIKKGRKGKAAPGTAAQQGVEPPADADPEVKEKFRFDQAKAKASEDPDVMELKAKADSAVSEEDTRSAQRAYNKALFSKMRKIDGSLEERISSMEAAILKRLDGK